MRTRSWSSLPPKVRRSLSLVVVRASRFHNRQPAKIRRIRTVYDRLQIARLPPKRIRLRFSVFSHPPFFARINTSYRRETILSAESPRDKRPETKPCAALLFRTLDSSVFRVPRADFAATYLSKPYLERRGRSILFATRLWKKDDLEFYPGEMRIHANLDVELDLRSGNVASFEMVCLRISADKILRIPSSTGPATIFSGFLARSDVQRR